MNYDIFSIQENILQPLREAVRSLDALPPEITLDRPKEKAHGDFATPVALLLAKKLKRPPLEIAQEILNRFKADPEIISKSEVAPPGFVNFSMNPKVYFKALADALKKGHDYGKNKKSRGRKLLLEFVSANPTGPLNVVSARAAVLGDSIANLLTASGTEVLREYYINDTGGQARLFGESLLAACDRLQGKNTQAPPEGYQGAYMEDLAKEYSGLSPAPEPSQWGMDRMVQWHQRSLAAYGVSFDRWFSEKKELHDSGVVDQTVTRLKGAGLTFEQAGALWIKTSEYGSPKDEVIVKSNGVPAYFVADIAYHLNKLERGYQQIVNIMGPDHHGHILRMKAAHRALGYPPESFMVLIAQQVNLLEGREKVKMSKREGKFVTMDELLQKVGKDAARFFFVMRSPNSHLDFDIEVALKQTDENPVYYVQYAHARICSLLRKAREAGLEPALQAEAMEPLLEGEELLLLKEMLEYPQWVEESGLAFEPHRIVAYLQKLAGDFHVFYSKCRMIGEAPELAQARLSLALGTKTVIRNALGLLGVSAPEQM